MIDYIKQILEKGTRIDERKLTDFRKPLKVEVNVSKNAEGSAKATIGETEVMVGVKLGLGEPFPDTADQGILIVNTELSPLCSPEFTLGPPGSQAIEIARRDYGACC